MRRLWRRDKSICTSADEDKWLGGLGSAAVYKHVPVYYPDNVGSVGGLVGMIGALGGFVLPIVFGFMKIG